MSTLQRIWLGSLSRRVVHSGDGVMTLFGPNLPFSAPLKTEIVESYDVLASEKTAQLYQCLNARGVTLGNVSIHCSSGDHCRQSHSICRLPGLIHWRVAPSCGVDHCFRVRCFCVRVQRAVWFRDESKTNANDDQRLIPELVLHWLCTLLTRSGCIIAGGAKSSWCHGVVPIARELARWALLVAAIPSWSGHRVTSKKE
jgi:hypothetical protein